MDCQRVRIKSDNERDFPSNPVFWDRFESRKHPRQRTVTRCGKPKQAINPGNFVFEQKLQVVFAVFVGSMQPILGERQVHHHPGLRGVLCGEPGLTLEPKLAMLQEAIIGEQSKRRFWMLLQKLREHRQEPGKLARGSNHRHTRVRFSWEKRCWIWVLKAFASMGNQIT